MKEFWLTQAQPHQVSEAYKIMLWLCYDIDLYMRTWTDNIPQWGELPLWLRTIQNRNDMIKAPARTSAKGRLLVEVGFAEYPDTMHI